MDGGLLEIAGTLVDGDSVAGSRSSICPATPRVRSVWGARRTGWRSSRTRYSCWDPFSVAGLPGGVRLPPPPIRPDDQAARASVRRIAELHPNTLWLGHYGPVTDDVRAQLERAANRD